MKQWRGEPDHDHWRAPFTGRERAAAFWGLGGVGFALGLVEWINPHAPPFTGRWGWLPSLAYNAIGPKGPAFGWFAIAIVLTLAGALAWTKK